MLGSMQFDGAKKLITLTLVLECVNVSAAGESEDSLLSSCYICEYVAFGMKKTKHSRQVG